MRRLFFGRIIGVNVKDVPKFRYGDGFVGRSFFATLLKNRPIDRAVDKRVITASDLVSLDDYLRDRKNKYYPLRKQLRKDRSFQIGPYVSIAFENYDLVWIQIQEMLAIERGGVGQVEEELTAYNPLVPNGSNIVFTFMIHIQDNAERNRLLYKFSHIEDTIYLEFGNERIRAISIDGDEFQRTDARGKTSAVHFLQFPLTDAQKEMFIHMQYNSNVTIQIEHPEYFHKVTLSEKGIGAIKEDLKI